MRILISNDDGVHATGIAVLANALSKIAEITVVAPDRNRSGASNSLTLQVPVRIQRLNNGFYSVTGTPTDCVHLALTSNLFKAKFDLVVSGINAGANLGDDVLYSGTVAAAMEGGNLGLPALAVSLVGHHPLNYYETAAKVTVKFIKAVYKHLPRQGLILNLNVPDLPYQQLQGFELTKLGKRHLAQQAVKSVDPRGNDVYWIGAEGDENIAGPGTDFNAIAHQKISISPIRLDLTAESSLPSLSASLEAFHLS